MEPFANGLKKTDTSKHLKYFLHLGNHYNEVDPCNDHHDRLAWHIITLCAYIGHCSKGAKLNIQEKTQERWEDCFGSHIILASRPLPYLPCVWGYILLLKARNSSYIRSYSIVWCIILIWAWNSMLWSSSLRQIKKTSLELKRSIMYCYTLGLVPSIRPLRLATTWI